MVRSEDAGADPDPHIRLPPRGYEDGQIFVPRTLPLPEIRRQLASDARPQCLAPSAKALGPQPSTPPDPNQELEEFSSTYSIPYVSEPRVLADITLSQEPTTALSTYASRPRLVDFS